MESIQISNIKRIQDASRNNKLVVFVGAGISMNSGVPSWGQLIESLKDELPSNLKDETDSLKIAQLYKEVRGHKEYFEKIKLEFKYGRVSPNPIHKAILDLHPCHIITTNYDDLLEQIIASENLQYHIIKKDADLPYTQHENMVIKMHGDFDTNNIVLTENDYYNYTDNFPLIDAFVKSLFATKLVLFVGFSFNDLNLKIILNSVYKLLKEDFQPIYLLTDISNDQVLTSYYNKKGINITWVSESILNRYLVINEKENTTINEIDNIYGKEVYRQLKVISDFQPKGDFIDILYSRVVSLQQELPYMVTCIEYLWPKNDCNYLNKVSFQSLNIRSKFLLALKDNLTSIKELRVLLQKYGTKIAFLRNVAFSNGIYRIDELQLFSKNSLNRRIRNQNKNTVDLIHDFNYKETADRIAFLRKPPLNYTSVDLELPYSYYLIGKYFEAYQLYKDYANQYWNKGKHILYFICMYNIKRLGNAIFNENYNNKLLDIKSVSEKIHDMDLIYILSKCQLDSNIKSVLSDLVNYNYYLDVLNESNLLVNNILGTKVTTENGGGSINSDVYVLEQKIFQCFDFSNMNYLINDNNSYSIQSNVNAVTGFLLSHSTPKKRLNLDGAESLNWETTRLEVLQKKHLDLMIHTLSLEQLKKIFKSYKIKDILVDDSSISYLMDILNNIYNQYDYYKSVIKHELFVKRFEVVLYICLKLKNEFDCVDIVSDIYIKYEFKDYRSNEIVDLLSDLIYKKGSISIEKSEKIIDIIISSGPSLRRKGHLVNAISYVLKKEGRALSNVHSFEQLNADKNNWNYIASFYHMVGKDIQDAILQLIKNNLVNISTIAELVVWYRIPIFDNTYLSRYIDLLKQENDNLDNHYYCLAALQDVYDNASDPELKDIVINYSNESPFLKFILDPISFSPDKVVPNWLYYCRQKDLRSLLDNKIYRQKARDFIKEKSDDAKRFEIFFLNSL